MRRTLPLCLFLLLAPAPAQAVLITGYALGSVTRNGSSGPGAHHFFPGENVYLVFQYDLDPALFMPRIGLDASTTDGFQILFTTGIGPPKSNIGFERDSILSLNTSDGSRDARIRFDGDVGTLEIFRERNNGTTIDAFDASLVRLEGPISLPLPEPSGLVLGAIGAGLVGFMGWRRRRR
jgi:hypothetical protein